MMVKKFNKIIGLVSLIGILACSALIVKIKLEPVMIKAEEPKAILFTMPDQINLTYGQSAVIDVIVDSLGASVSAIYSEIPFDNKNVKVTRLDFKGAVAGQNLNNIKVDEINDNGLIVINRKYDGNNKKVAINKQFLLVSIWLTYIGTADKTIEILPDSEKITIFDQNNNKLAPVENGGTVISLEREQQQTVTRQQQVEAVNPNTIPVPIVASEDAYVSIETPQQNHGSENLKVGGESLAVAFLKFDLRKIGNKKINSATLRIKLADRPVGTLRIRKTVNKWSENSINYKNSPVLGAELAVNEQEVASGWMETDISDYVKMNNKKEISLILDSPDDGEYVFFSKDGGRDQPYILVQ